MSHFNRNFVPRLLGAGFAVLMLASHSFGQEGRLKPNDVVKMAIFQEDDLTTQAKILKSGEASFPLIGSVKISGLSVAEATKAIRDRYAADYLVDPQVTLSVDTYAVQHVSVVGAVKSPGQIVYPETGTFDLLSAIGSAGGPMENADLNKISLVRASGGQAVYTYTALRTGGPVTLQPGDRVIVYESAFVRKTVTILGEVKKPGAVEFPLDGSLDLLTAIAMAGGYTDIARESKVSVSRNGKVTMLDAKAIAEGKAAKFMLQPGDIVKVFERII